MRVVDYIADFLVSKNVKMIFTVTGGGAMHLNDALGKHSKLKSLYMHHEQAAAMAAEGYARIKNRPAVCCVTTGPGGINALNGVAGAYTDSIPMIVISGQVKFTTTQSAYPDLKIRQLGDQEFDIISVAKTMTKFATMIKNPCDIRYYLERAFFEATTGRMGPVWLDIPLDVQAAEIEITKLMPYYPSGLPRLMITKELKLLMDMIRCAKKPLFMIGNGVHLSGAERQFMRLVNQSKIPVVTGFNAHDIIPTNHPLYAGRPGTIGERCGNFAVQNADLLIVIGMRLNIRQISYNYENFASKAQIVMVDIDQNEMDKPTIKPVLKICADALLFIKQLRRLITPLKIKPWHDYIAKVKATFNVVLPEYYNRPVLNPYVFAAALTEHWPKQAVVVTANASAWIITSQTAIIHEEQRLFSNSGMASMGYGLPAAIGAYYGSGNKIICIEGDGSLQMNIQELITVSYHQLPIKIFVYNNGGYHSIRQTQMNFFGTPLVGVGADSHDLAFPDLQKLAKAYNLRYLAIRTEADLALIQDVMGGRRPYLVEVFVDPNQGFAPKLSSRRLSDGSMVSSRLEDMFPFLPDGVVKEFNDI